MKRQVEVRLLVAKTLFEITTVVNEWIRKGYVLQGAVTPVYKEGYLSYLATMVLEV